MGTEDQILPSLPLPSGPEALLGRRQKGGITPLWQRGARGDFLRDMSSLLWTPK